MNREEDKLFLVKINQLLRFVNSCNKNSTRQTISQVYLPSLWLLLSILNPVEASDRDSDYDQKEVKLRYQWALIFILAYTTMTLAFVIFIYLRKQISRRRNEEEEAETAAQHDENSITTATGKLDIRVIESFPEIIFPRTDAKFHFTDCHICLEEFKQGESLVMLPTCGHAYHKECIHRWMATRNLCCPDCRHDYGLL